jgi:hypothetical protein
MNIMNELKKLSAVWFKIIDSNCLFNKPLSIRFSYKQELRNFAQIVDQAQPDVFVVANDQGISATFIRICKLRGIPSVAIQDGILTNKRSKGFSSFLAWKGYFPWRIVSLITNIPAISMLSIRLGRQWCVPVWGMGDATVIAAMGNYYKRVFVSRGIHPDRIVVTGYPLLDDLLKNDSDFDTQSDFFEKIGLLYSKPLILLITQPFVEDGLWEPALRVLYFESVVNAVRHVNGQLVVKVHPRENLDVYRLLANKHLDINIVVTKDFNLDRLLASSDVVVTVSSTVGLWALAYGKPLLVTSCFPCVTKNVLEDMAMTVGEIHELPRTLSSIVKNAKLKANLLHKTRKTLFDHVYRLDGEASARIARLILTMTKKKL